MAALVASVTWPTIALVVSPCASVTVGWRDKSKPKKIDLVMVYIVLHGSRANMLTEINYKSKAT
jgi:hypothetical protein